MPFGSLLHTPLYRLNISPARLFLSDPGIYYSLPAGDPLHPLASFPGFVVMYGKTIAVAKDMPRKRSFIRLMIFHPLSFIRTYTHTHVYIRTTPCFGEVWFHFLINVIQWKCSADMNVRLRASFDSLLMWVDFTTNFVAWPCEEKTEGRTFLSSLSSQFWRRVVSVTLCRANTGTARFGYISAPRRDRCRKVGNQNKIGSISFTLFIYNDNFLTDYPITVWLIAWLIDFSSIIDLKKTVFSHLILQGQDFFLHRYNLQWFVDGNVFPHSRQIFLWSDSMYWAKTKPRAIHCTCACAEMEVISGR